MSPAAPPAGFDRRLVTGVARIIADAGLGSWSEAAPYTAAQRGIYVMNEPSEATESIVLSPYAIGDDARGAGSQQGLNVRCRMGGPTFAVMDLDSAIFDVLHMLSMTTLSTGVIISQCLRRSSASLGQDSSRRWSHSSNYYLDVYRPGPLRSA